MGGTAAARTNQISQALRSFWGTKPEPSKSTAQSKSKHQKAAAGKAQHAQHVKDGPMLRSSSATSRQAPPAASASRPASAQQQRPAAAQEQRPASANAQPSQHSTGPQAQGPAAVLGQYTVWTVFANQAKPLAVSRGPTLRHK